MAQRIRCNNDELFNSYTIEFRGMLLPFTNLCSTSLMEEAWKEYLESDDDDHSK